MIGIDVLLYTTREVKNPRCFFHYFTPITFCVPDDLISGKRTNYCINIIQYMDIFVNNILRNSIIHINKQCPPEIMHNAHNSLN